MSPVRVSLFAALVVAACIGATPLAAAPRNAPAGTYLDTCRSVEVEIRGHILIAECRDDRGRWRETVLERFDRCRGDIYNDDGELGCGHARAADQRGPSGAWRDSCRKPEIVGDTLYAECLDNRGRWRESEIRWRDCNGGVRNNNGRLVCDRGERLPPGSWAQTCRDPELDDNVLYARCPDRNGRWYETQIDWRACGRTISNRDGELDCDTDRRLGEPPGYEDGRPRDETAINEDGGGFGPGGMPGGTWSTSCRNPKIEDGVLAAECRRTENTWRFTELELRTCRSGSASNVDGRLTCD